MRMILSILFSILLLAAFAPAQVIMIQQVANSKKPGAPSGPTYTRVASESGNNFDPGGGSVTVNTVNGDAVFMTCSSAGTVSGTAEDSNGETWNEIVSTNVNPATSVWYAIIALGGDGDDLDCTTGQQVIVDGFRSSTGWNTADLNAASIERDLGASICSTTAIAPTAQAKEMGYGVCISASGTSDPNSAAGYTLAQDTGLGTCLVSGVCSTFFQSVTSISTPTFTTSATGVSTNVTALVFMQPN